MPTSTRRQAREQRLSEASAEIFSEDPPVRDLDAGDMEDEDEELEDVEDEEEENEEDDEMQGTRVHRPRRVFRN